MPKKEPEVEVKPSTDLALLPPAERASIVMKSDVTAKELRALAAASADIVSVIDGAGREQAHRIGMTLKTARVAIEKTGKDVRADATAFSKAVIAKEAELVALIEPEETRIMALRDAFDAKVRAEKEEAERIERDRIAKHSAALGALRANVPAMVGKPYVEINQRVVDLTDELPTEEVWEEFTPRAIEVYTEVCDQLKAMASTQLDIEMEARLKAVQAKEEAERVAAQAEANRLAQIELDRQRAEIAAAAKKIAEDKAAADKAEADARAKRTAEEVIARAERERQEAEARAARERIDSEARAVEAKATADKHAAEMAKLKAEADKLAEERAAFQAKLDAQAAEDARRKQVLADEAEAARVAALPVERVVEILEAPPAPEPAPAPHMLSIVPTPPFAVPDDLGVTSEQVAEIIEVEAFRLAARALLEHQSAEEVMNLLDEVIDSMMNDAPDSVGL